MYEQILKALSPLLSAFVPLLRAPDVRIEIDEDTKVGFVDKEFDEDHMFDRRYMLRLPVTNFSRNTAQNCRVFLTKIERLKEGLYYHGTLPYEVEADPAALVRTLSRPEPELVYRAMEERKFCDFIDTDYRGSLQLRWSHEPPERQSGIVLSKGMVKYVDVIEAAPDKRPRSPLSLQTEPGVAANDKLLAVFWIYRLTLLAVADGAASFEFRVVLLTTNGVPVIYGSEGRSQSQFKRIRDDIMTRQIE